MTGFVLRLGCALFLLLLSCLLVLLVILLIGASPAHAAREGDGQPVLLVAARSSAPLSPTVRGEFAHGVVRVVVPDARCRVWLAGDARGSADITVDDKVTLVARLGDGGEHRWSHEFGAGGRVMPVPPVDLTGALGTDLSELEFVLEDLQPPTFGNSDLWLLPCANLAALATPTVPLPSPTPTAPKPLGSAAGVGPGATPPPTPARPPDAPGGGSLLIPFLGGLVGLAAGGLLLGLVVAARRRKPRLRLVPAMRHLLILDPLNNTQLYQPITLDARPLGIAYNPLRLVPAGAAEAACTLLPENGLAQASVVYTDPAAPPPIVLLDGQRLAVVYQNNSTQPGHPAGRRPSAERVTVSPPKPIEPGGS
jgi:hypothetical protein